MMACEIIVLTLVVVTTKSELTQDASEVEKVIDLKRGGLSFILPYQDPLPETPRIKLLPRKHYDEAVLHEDLQKDNDDRIRRLVAEDHSSEPKIGQPHNARPSEMENREVEVISGGDGAKSGEEKDEEVGSIKVVSEKMAEASSSRKGEVVDSSSGTKEVLAREESLVLSIINDQQIDQSDQRQLTSIGEKAIVNEEKHKENRQRITKRVTTTDNRKGQTEEPPIDVEEVEAPFGFSLRQYYQDLLDYYSLYNSALAQSMAGPLTTEKPRAFPHYYLVYPYGSNWLQARSHEQPGLGYQRNAPEGATGKMYTLTMDQLLKILNPQNSFQEEEESLSHSADPPPNSGHPPGDPEDSSPNPFVPGPLRAIFSRVGEGSRGSCQSRKGGTKRSRDSASQESHGPSSALPTSLGGTFRYTQPFLHTFPVSREQITWPFGYLPANGPISQPIQYESPSSYHDDLASRATNPSKETSYARGSAPLSSPQRRMDHEQAIYTYLVDGPLTRDGGEASVNNPLDSHEAGETNAEGGSQIEIEYQVYNPYVMNIAEEELLENNKPRLILFNGDQYGLRSRTEEAKEGRYAQGHHKLQSVYGVQETDRSYQSYYKIMNPFLIAHGQEL